MLTSVSSIHEHKGKQELFLEANVDELKTLLEVALIQSTGASNRIEGISTGYVRVLKNMKAAYKFASQKRMDKPSRMRYIIYRQENNLVLMIGKFN